MKVAFCILSFLESILLQMERVLRTRPGGVVGKLLAKPNPGWRILRDSLMLLDPKDLKACRQSCKSLNEFIKSEVWGTEGGKKLVTQKLLNRWMTADARPEDLGTVGQEVANLVCNDQFIFCSDKNGIVDVFSIASGDLVRQLLPDENVAGEIEERISGRVAVKEGLVASALIRTCDVGFKCCGSIWSTGGEMEMLNNFSFPLPAVPDEEGDDGDGRNYRLLRFHVCSLTTVVALISPFDHRESSLLVANKEETGWECLTLHSIQHPAAGFPWIPFALEGEAMALVKDSSESRVTLVWNRETQKNLDLPSWRVDYCVKAMALMLPHLVLLLEEDREAENQLPTNPQVNVYKMASGSSEGSLVKSLSLDSPRSFFTCLCFYNNLLLGFVQYHIGEDGMDSRIHVFEKDSLVDENKTARRRLIALPSLVSWTNMNTTSLVYSSARQLFNPFIGSIFKRDFWID